MLFGVEPGGGNDTPRALAYCQGLIRRPPDTVFILISDLYGASSNAAMLQRAAAIARSGCA